MSVLTIRACKRYATRLPVELRCAGRKQVGGLLIELSQQGMRISNLGSRKFAVGDHVKVSLAGGMELAGSIRWAHDGIVGVTLVSALHQAELRDLLDLSQRRQYDLVAPAPEPIAAIA